MKRTRIEFTFDSAKLEALKLFMKEKNVTLTEELDRSMDGLYKKYVPQTLRDYFEKQEAEARQAEAAKKSKGKQSVGTAPAVSEPPAEG
jgi:hypothetical protein